MMEGVIQKTGRMQRIGDANDSDGSFSAIVEETEEYYEGYKVNQTTGICETVKSKLYKDKWEKFFEKGDDYLSVHIPKGDGFTKEECEKSYEEAKRILTKCYPERDFKVFLCASWMLSPDMKSIAREGSNLMNFWEKFYKFPIPASGAGVFTFIFNMSKTMHEIDFTKLPENTSLERNIKNIYTSGGIVHEGGGIFKF